MPIEYAYALIALSLVTIGGLLATLWLVVGRSRIRSAMREHQETIRRHVDASPSAKRTYRAARIFGILAVAAVVSGAVLFTTKGVEAGAFATGLGFVLQIISMWLSGRVDNQAYKERDRN